MDGLINQAVLIKWVKPLVKKLIEKYIEESEGATMDINEFRRKNCGGKGQEWVRLYIFDKFRDEIEVNPETKTGFVINPRGGKKTIIYRKKAKEWMEDNFYRINWNGSIKKDYGR